MHSRRWPAIVYMASGVVAQELGWDVNIALLHVVDQADRAGMTPTSLACVLVTRRYRLTESGIAPGWWPPER